ncbi:hypothetical protein [Vibrio phage CKB-S1]|nr:hypothetical protein [Vibrio phage CKB-S1]
MDRPVKTPTWRKVCYVVIAVSVLGLTMTLLDAIGIL